MEDRKKEILEALEKLHKKEVANKESWKARAYLTVLKQIKTFDKPVYSIDDIKHLKGVGKSIQAKITEILETGKLQQIEDYNANPKIKAINELITIHGIGPSKAKELVDDHGILSIQDLIEKQELLNDKQKMGLKYHKDFEKRIPRKEMTKHEEYIVETIQKIDPKLIVTLTGSYRRKLPDSGDIDVLINHPDDPENFEPLFKKIVSTLQKDYIKDVFAEGGKKCMAVCKLKYHRSFRRLDLLYTRSHEYPFALMYFTGSSDFNVDLRNLAINKGYSLSEYGIKYTKGKKKGEFIDKEFHSENDIFEFFGLEYVEPHKRLRIKTN